MGLLTLRYKRPKLTFLNPYASLQEIPVFIKIFKDDLNLAEVRPCLAVYWMQYQ